MSTSAVAASPPAGTGVAQPVLDRGRLVGIGAPILVGVLASIVSGYHVGVPAVWRDEAASITMAQRDWPAFLATIAHVDAVHALYYLLLHLWFSVVPYTPFTLRLPSVLAIGGTAALLVVLGRRLAGLRAGIAAGLASAVLPALVWAGGEGRSYAFTALLATGTTLALLHALAHRPSRRAAVLAWVGYAALLALGATLFIDAALLGAAHAVTILLLGRRRRIAGVAAVATALLAVAPLLLLAARQGGQVSWISKFGSPPLWTTGIRDQWFRSEQVMIAWAAVLAGGLVIAAIRRRVPTRALAVALPWAVLPPVLLVGVALVHAPVYWPRYVTFTAPAVALLVGVLIGAAPVPLTAAALLLLALLAVPQVRADRQPRAKADSEMELAAQLVARSRSADDGPAGILYGKYGDVRGMTTRVEQIAYPADFRGLTDLNARVPLQRSTELFGQDIPNLATPPRMARLRTVWILLDLQSYPKTVLPTAAMKRIGLHETGVFRAPGSMLIRWSR